MNEMPQNIEAEKAVLGSILICKNQDMQNDVLYRVSQKIKVDDFYRSANKRIYMAMLDMCRKNKAIDNITLVEHLNNCHELERVGGIAYITALCNEVPSSAHVERYAEIVRDKAIKRDFINISRQNIELVYNADDVDEAADTVEKNIFSIRQQRESTRAEIIEPGQRVLSSLADIEKRCANGGQLSGIDTGFTDLNKMTGGFQNSDLIIIAARPAMGKTALALTVAYNVAVKHKIPTLFFSLEMSSSQLDSRLFSIAGLINSNNMRKGDLSDEELKRLRKTADIIAGSPLYIDDTPGQNIMEVMAKARRLKREKDIQLIMVDYLQLIAGGKNKDRSREQEVSELSRQLKILARELNIPIIALAQLSREPEKRNDKRPMLSDLRDSGAIEQDADIVAFLYRHGYYYKSDKDGNPVEPNATEFIIAKHRNGEIGKVDLYFHLEYCRFENMYFDNNDSIC